MHHQAMTPKPPETRRRQRTTPNRQPGCRPYIAVALMIQLARKPDQLVSSHVLASALGLRLGFMEKLIADLRHAGLIVSFRGPSGGFRLSKAAPAISALDIFQAIEPTPQRWRTPYLAWPEP